MATKDLVDAVGGKVQTALNGDVVLTKVPPAKYDPSVGAYLYTLHKGYIDTRKAMGGQVNRVHHIDIGLLMRFTTVQSEDIIIEDVFLDYCDIVANLFYTDHTVGGVLGTTELHQLDAGQGGSRPSFIQVSGGPLVRQRLWTLWATEYLVFRFA